MTATTTLGWCCWSHFHGRRIECSWTVYGTSRFVRKELFFLYCMHKRASFSLSVDPSGFPAVMTRKRPFLPWVNQTDWLTHWLQEENEAKGSVWWEIEKSVPKDLLQYTYALDKNSLDSLPCPPFVELSLWRPIDRSTWLCFPPVFLWSFFFPCL